MSMTVEPICVPSGTGPNCVSVPAHMGLIEWLPSGVPGGGPTISIQPRARSSFSPGHWIPQKPPPSSAFVRSLVFVLKEAADRSTVSAREPPPAGESVWYDEIREAGGIENDAEGIGSLPPGR